MNYWSELYPETLPRPTTKRRRWTPFEGRAGRFGKTVRKGRWEGGIYYPPMTATGESEDYDVPQYSPYEILRDVARRFEAQPVSYRTDPSGKVVATKTMAKPEMPTEMAGMPSRMRGMFGEGELESSWILPKGARTGPRFVQTAAPPSDVERQTAHLAGISGVGKRFATVNPQTFWPESAFKVPWRGPEQKMGISGRQPYTKPEPVFGGTVDYTSGEWRTPGGMYADPWGRFEGARKTPPMIGAFRPRRFRPSRRRGGGQDLFDLWQTGQQENWGF